MSNLRLWSVILLVLFVAAAYTTAPAWAWSEAVYTKPWTEEETDTEEEPPALPGEEANASEIPEPPKIKEKLEEAPAVEIDDFLLDFEGLYGTWYIWTPSTVVNISAPGGEYIGHKHVEGADQGFVAIYPDGSYTMSHAAWAKDETVSGTWRLSYPREINGEVLQAIVLLDGITAVDWAVAPSPSGKVRLLWAMGWADGSATWIFDSELIKP